MDPGSAGGGCAPAGEALSENFRGSGQAGTTCCALIFQDFNLRPWSLWSLWLAGSFACMLFYELWWIRYFRGPRKLEDFYGSWLGVPVPGAVLPPAAFLLLGIYGRVVWMVLAALVLGLGHVGIHWEHRRALNAGSR